MSAAKTPFAIRRILVPLDFSETSSEALRRAALLAREHRAEIDLLHVVWDPPPYVGLEVMLLTMPADGEGSQSLRDFAKLRALDAMKRSLAHLPEPWRTRAGRRVSYGHPAEEIVELVTVEGYDLIVMGTHGRAGVARALLGSVTERVVRTAPCPIYIVRGVAQNADSGLLIEHPELAR